MHRPAAIGAIGRWLVAGAVIVIMMACGPTVLAAQERDPETTGQTQDDALERLRASGMSRSEVRSRLQMMGYDPSMAEPYFDALERGGEVPADESSEEFVAALNRMSDVPGGDTLSGMDPEALVRAELLRADYRFRADSIYRARMASRDSIALAEAGVSDLGLPLFGRSVFARQTTEFEAVTDGPVPDSYRLGPGDEVNLVMTGDAEFAYPLRVNRAGYLVIPDVGQVPVNGLTLDELEDVLYDRLGRVFSGVERGPDATARFHVTLGRLRTNQVFLVGEVERPGSYEVSAAGSAFTALYQAGGPAVTGSFRAVEVRRGGRTVATMDLYAYLLQGQGAEQVQLQHGDMLFVPLAGPRVSVTGGVRRAAIYEVRDGESLRDVLGFAGGFRPQAIVERVQVSRILPPEQRQPGIERVVIDIPMEDLLSERPLPVHDGDVVRVFEITGPRRRFVELTGEVHRPGTYEWRPGLTLAALVDEAAGVDSAAYTDRVHIFRLDTRDGSRQLIQADLESDAAATLLADRDSVVVYSREELRTEQVVELSGYVKRPGTYVLAEGMTLQDVILAAGGYTDGAFELEAEIARMPDPQSRTDTTAQLILAPLARADDETMASWQPGPDDVRLRHGDRVFVRRAPGFDEARVAVVTGEVLFPGPYVLQSRHERLVDLIRRAGGPTPQAYASGFQLIRAGHLVGTDLSRALDDPDSRHNVRIEAGDSLHVPAYDPTVLITGAVAFETRALYEPGRDLAYYIGQAGGYTDDADRARVSVTYQNGEREVVDRFLFWRFAPEVRPGASVHVPVEPPEAGFNWDRFLTQSLAVATTAATVLIAVSQIN